MALVAEADRSMNVEPELVVQALWDMDAWRRTWNPIERVVVTYQDLVHQEFVMDVERNKRVERVRTIRFRRPDRIEFFSPEPPPSMTRHCGVWAVTPAPGGSQVTAVRRFDLRAGAGDSTLAVESLTARLAAILDRFAAALEGTRST